MYCIQLIDNVKTLVTYQEVFLKNGNSGAAARMEERVIETQRGNIYDLGYIAIAMFCH